MTSLPQQSRCIVVSGWNPCCMVLVSSCPRWLWVPRLAESLVQGVPGQSVQCTIALWWWWFEWITCVAAKVRLESNAASTGRCCSSPVEISTRQQQQRRHRSNCRLSVAVTCPIVCNSLPTSLRQPDTEFRQFKWLLKAFLFGETTAH